MAVYTIMARIYVLLSCFYLYAFANAQSVNKTSALVQGKVENYPLNTVTLIYDNIDGRKEMTTATDKNGRFSFVIEKLTAPAFATLQSFNSKWTNLYIAPGYRLTFTADVKNDSSLRSGIKLQGIGAASNRYELGWQTVNANRKSTVDWIDMKTPQLLAFIMEGQRLRDSLYHNVFDRKQSNDPWFDYFKRLIKTDIQIWKLYYLVVHAIDNKQFSDTEMISFVRNNGDSTLFDNLFKDEYMTLDSYGWLMFYDYAIYLRTIDCRKAANICNDKKYNLEVLEKIAQVYKGPIRERALKAKMRSSIMNCRSYDEWTGYKKAFPRYMKFLSNPGVNATLDSLLNNMGNRMVKLEIRKPAPLFSAVDSTGKVYSLADFKGKVVYIDLWASWCGPCRGLTPYYEKLYNKLKNDDRIVCLSIAVQDKEDKWKAALRQDNPSWLQLWDKNGNVQNAFVANSLPRFVLIDKQGNIVKADAPMPDDAVIENLLLQEMDK